MSLKRFQVPGGEVVLLATVQGLVAERERVRQAYAVAKPSVVALGASPEAVGSLLTYAPDPEADPFDELPDVDVAYSLRLGEFGDVSLPPACLLEAARLAGAEGLPVHGIDMPEDAYETLFTKTVSVWGFLKYGRVQRRLAKRPPKAASALEFCLAWDRAMRKVKGLARVEAAREAHMASRARELAAQSGRVLLVVDAARAAGIEAALSGQPTA